MSLKGWHMAHGQSPERADFRNLYFEHVSPARHKHFLPFLAFNRLVLVQDQFL